MDMAAVTETWPFLQISLTATLLAVNRSSMLALLTLLALPLAAQTPPGEKGMISRSVNRWVAMEREGRYDVDFVYLREHSSLLTLHDSGRFRLDENGRCVKVAGHMPEANVHHVATKNIPVVVLSEKCRAELGLPERPDAAGIGGDTQSLEYRIRLAGVLNLMDPDAGLEILESAYKENPGAEGLAFELASLSYADNHNDRALAVATEGIKRDPKDCRLGQFLGDLLFIRSKNDEAIERYLATMPVCSDNEIKAKMAVNLAVMYRERGDRKNAETWTAYAKTLNGPR
jgi:hypothetical protein